MDLTLLLFTLPLSKIQLIQENQPKFSISSCSAPYACVCVGVCTHLCVCERGGDTGIEVGAEIEGERDGNRDMN